MNEWHLYQHNENEDVRYWVEENLNARPWLYEDRRDPIIERVLKIRSPRNIASEPDVYAWPAERSVPSGLMPFDTFLKLYTRVSSD